MPHLSSRRLCQLGKRLLPVLPQQGMAIRAINRRHGAPVGAWWAGQGTHRAVRKHVFGGGELTDSDARDRTGVLNG